MKKKQQKQSRCLVIDPPGTGSGLTTVTLHQVGFSPEICECANVEEAARMVVDFQDDRGMGASDMGRQHGLVRVDGVLTNKISYNGRVQEVSR